MAQAKEIKAVTQHAKEDLDDKGDEGNRGKDAHFGHIDAITEQIKGVQ
jgi:hypothetical protein